MPPCVPLCPLVPPCAPLCPLVSPRAPQLLSGRLATIFWPSILLLLSGRPFRYYCLGNLTKMAGRPDNSWGARGDTREHYPDGEGGGKVGEGFLKNGFLAKTRVPW